MNELIVVHCVCGRSKSVKVGELKRCICGRMLQAKENDDGILQSFMTIFDRHEDDGRRTSGDMRLIETKKKQPNR